MSLPVFGSLGATLSFTRTLRCSSLWYLHDTSASSELCPYSGDFYFGISRYEYSSMGGASP